MAPVDFFPQKNGKIKGGRTPARRVILPRDLVVPMRHYLSELALGKI
jgi:hypothetical protein